MSDVTEAAVDDAGAPASTPLRRTRRRPRKKQGWSLAAKVATWTISIVSFVTGIIAVVPILTRDATNFDALRITSAPYPSTSTEWALPLDAEFDGFPAGSAAGCTEAQRSWLERHGSPLTTQIMLDMRNKAREGAMLTLKDFRVDGTREGAADRFVRVVCDTAPPSTVRVQAARLDASSAAGVAVLSAAAYGATTVGLPDTPVAWNLAPGETGQLLVRLFSSVPVAGTLGVTVLNADESRSVTLDDIDVALVPLVGDGLVYLRAGAGLECVDVTGDEPVACELAEVLAGE